MTAAAALIDGIAPDWCDETLDRHARRQLAPPWCLPACLAILFDGGSECGERAAAQALGLDAPAPHALDLRDANAYARLRRELARRGMHEAFAPCERALLRHEWLGRARRPVLVSVGHHAVICTGACADSIGVHGERQPAWRVLDPGDGRVEWRALPRAGLALEFAFA